MKATGILDYDVKDGYFRLVALLSPDFGRLYRSLLPKSVRCNPGMYPSHVTVVRGEAPNSNWGKYQGKEILLSYDPYIHYRHPYFWVNVFSDELTNIRLELGLERSYHLSRPPDDAECFHCTIGNDK